MGFTVPDSPVELLAGSGTAVLYMLSGRFLPSKKPCLLSLPAFTDMNEEAWL
ncbi:hypothetical protein HMPREF9141_1616 [Prevotella multiformis DSM 16608]|uniref:Uncharacterized protein n=1 Tax=Prevotella multiformis DSM 16608 TaxID=888743 RepID=F0F7P9_9BACT|nr:hypothetical protein HMPREF9141_1616 [Prevotella multiformis DSM 16608]